VIVVLAVAVVAVAAGVAIGLSLARRSRQDEFVTAHLPPSGMGAIVSPPPAAPSAPGTVLADPAAGVVAGSLADAVAAPVVASMNVTTAELAPVLARLRELGADGVIDPAEKADLEAKASAAMPGATIDELTVDPTGYRLRVRHRGADIVASGTWTGGEGGQSVTVSQTITHAFDASSGADLGAITDPQLRSMVEGMLNALDARRSA
jgi:hypothetical protein